jgi:hypothetical protein
VAPAEQVRGFLEDRAGAKLAAPLLFGKWDEAMWAELQDGSQHLLWQKAPPPADPTRCAGATSPARMQGAKTGADGHPHLVTSSSVSCEKLPSRSALTQSPEVAGVFLHVRACWSHSTGDWGAFTRSSAGLH